MKKYIILFTLICVTSNIFSQIVINGKVTDNKDNVLSGATITLSNSTSGTITNKDGFYSLSVSKNDSYTLICSYVGYISDTNTINFNEEMQCNFILQEANIHTEEIIVQAIKANETTPVAQTNLSKLDIEKSNFAADIPFLLESTPSVVSSSENGTGIGYTGLRIRGTDISRINVSINGIPLNDAESQGVYWVDLPDFASSVEDIQIQRGVGTSSNGAAAFGASINFQTKDYSKTPYAELSSTLGSFNTFKRNISVGTGLLKNHFSIDVRYSKLNSDGWIERGKSDHESFYISGIYKDEKNMLRATVLSGEEHTGITWWGVPDYMMSTNRQYNPSGKYIDSLGNEAHYDNETDNYWQNHYQLHFSRIFSEYFNANISAHYTSGKGYYDEYIAETDDWGSDNSFANYGLPNVLGSDTVFTKTDMIRQKWMKNNFYGYTLSLNYAKNKISASIGSSFNIYNGNHYGLINWTKINSSTPKDYEWYNNDGKKQDFMVFGKIRYELLKNVFAFVDLQYRNINYSMNGIDDDLINFDTTFVWNFFNPKAGIFYKLGKNQTIFASYAQANREPSRYDLKDAIKAPESGIPTSEKLHDIELGYQLVNKNFQIGLNLFFMYYKDQLVNTGRINNVGYSIMTNVEKSYREGIELSGTAKFLDHFDWALNLSLSKNKIMDYNQTEDFYDADWNYLDTRDVHYDITDISFSPSVVGNSTLSFYIKKYFRISFVTKYVGKQFIDNTSSDDRSLDPYFISNIVVNTSIPCKFLRKLNFDLMLNNIFNAEYSSNAYGGADYVNDVPTSWIYYFPQAPFNLMGKLTIGI